MTTLELFPAFGWECIRCGRKNFTQFPQRLFLWDSPEDLAELRRRYVPEDLEKLKAAFPRGYRVTLLPLIHECRCGFTYRAYGKDESPLEPADLRADLPDDPEEAPESIPAASVSAAATFPEFRIDMTSFDGSTVTTTTPPPAVNPAPVPIQDCC